MRRALVLAVGVAVIAVIAVTVVVLRSPADQPAISVDAPRLRETERRLVEVRRALTALPGPDSATATSPLEVHGCYLDSGDIGQPWLGRTWEVSDGTAEAAALEVVDAMRRGGWTPTERSVSGSFLLLLRRDGWTARAWVGAMFEEDGV